MRRTLLAAALLLLAPASAIAASATFSAGRSLITASPAPGNSYAAGVSVVVASPVVGDFSSIAGSAVITAPVGGDVLLLGGSIHSRARIGGDLRALGGSITIERPVLGDLSFIGVSMKSETRPGGSVFVTAAEVNLAAGAVGPVLIYGNSVTLSGDFGGDVRVIASGHVSLVASTTIKGAFTYQSPEEASIASSAIINGGTTYTNATYLPSSSVSKSLAVASIGIFLLAHMLGAIILAGLLAGLFPKLGEAVARRATLSVRKVLLTTLLGFAALVATPVFLLLLTLTFVGIGMALLLLILYALLALLAYAHAGILLGHLLARKFGSRTSVSWRDGVIGMFALTVLSLIPFVGWIILTFLCTFSAGAILLVFFHVAFPKEPRERDLL